ncbi:MAG: glucose-1-phosphate adenylyltransferase subunit GlgD [Lachnospiraceae bacterium]|nr:glucose-1-phosphate adenylyltransferase subunit GlgD [Lachnospiraceae bacterium]
MVNANANALGILFPNSYDTLVPELTAERLMASIPFAGRYRLVDFVLSGMMNAGIDNISLIVRKNYHSLMDHLGSGREWDLTRKNGGLNLVPPFSGKAVKVYNGKVEALANIVEFLKSQKEKYVVLSDTHIIGNLDFKKLINAHIESGADVTMAYQEAEIPEEWKDQALGSEMHYSLEIQDGRVEKILVNSKRPGLRNLSLNVYVMNRELLIEQVERAFVLGYVYLERDILAPNLDKLDVRAYRFDGYVVRIRGLRSYFDENMKLLDDENLDALFSGNRICTKIRDDNPTRYIKDARAENVLVADGCMIEGEVGNSILFRGVRIEKGAKVKNCILMQDTVVRANVEMEYVISDKNVTITEGQQIRGSASFPVYVAKAKVV